MSKGLFAVCFSIKLQILPHILALQVLSLNLPLAPKVAKVLVNLWNTVHLIASCFMQC